MATGAIAALCCLLFGVSPIPDTGLAKFGQTRAPTTATGQNWQSIILDALVLPPIIRTRVERGGCGYDHESLPSATEAVALWANSTRF